MELSLFVVFAIISAWVDQRGPAAGLWLPIACWRSGSGSDCHCWEGG